MTNSNSDRCPLCEAANHCAITSGQNADGCWCQHTAISPSLIAEARKTSKRDRCICQRCAERAQQLARQL